MPSLVSVSSIIYSNGNENALQNNLVDDDSASSSKSDEAIKPLDTGATDTSRVKFQGNQEKSFRDVSNSSNLPSPSLPASTASNAILVKQVAESVSEQGQKNQSSASSVNSNSQHNSSVNSSYLNTTCDWYESGFLEANSELCGSDAGEHIRNYFGKIFK